MDSALGLKENKEGAAEVVSVAAGGFKVSPNFSAGLTVGRVPLAGEGNENNGCFSSEAGLLVEVDDTGTAVGFAPNENRGVLEEVLVETAGGKADADEVVGAGCWPKVKLVVEEGVEITGLSDVEGKLR